MKSALLESLARILMKGIMILQRSALLLMTTLIGMAFLLGHSHTSLDRAVSAGPHLFEYMEKGNTTRILLRPAREDSSSTLVLHDPQGKAIMTFNRYPHGGMSYLIPGADSLRGSVYASPQGELRFCVNSPRMQTEASFSTKAGVGVVSSYLCKQGPHYRVVRVSDDGKISVDQDL